MENLLVPSVAAATLPGQRVLVIAPHPDDEVFGCGGAILRHLEQGAAVHVRIWTTGGYGVAADKKAAYIATRQRESTAAARILGYGTPEFGTAEDRALQYSEKLVHELLALIAAHQADLVYAPSVLEMHPDHRVLGMASVEAVRRLGKELRLAQYEIGIPLRPNLLLDITGVAARKLEAMQCFESQLAKQRYDLDVAGLNRYRSWTLPPEVTAAEAYLVATGEELQGDPLGVYQSEHAKQTALGLPLDSRDLPLVSVIIRSMDRPGLGPALDSVALQTYQNIEVVLVNASGKVHTSLGEWCGRFPLRMIEPGRALERSAAANCGLDAARGEFLVFLDDDDIFLPQHLARLVAELKLDHVASAAYAGVIGTDDTGKEVQRFDTAFDPVRLRIGNYIPIHALLFRRAALARGARFDESLAVCEDWDFWLQLLEQGAFRHVPEPSAIYHMQSAAGSGVWSNPEHTRNAMLRIYRKWAPRPDGAVLQSLFEYAQYRFKFDELSHQKAEQDAANHQRIMKLEHDRADKERAIATLSRQVEDKTSQVAQLESAYSAQIAHLRNLNQAVQNLGFALDTRDAQLEAIRHSTSWRITGPLRAAVRLVRGKPADASTIAATSGESQTSATPQPVAAPPAEVAAAAPEAARQHTYDYAVDLQAKTAPAFVCELVGKNKRVLEIGCGPGSITRMMKTAGQCRVTGIEVDPSAIALARRHCEAIYQQDLNAENWPQVLGSAEPFDVVVAADVLEHVYDPWRTLRQMASLIGREGSIVVSLPHAAHAALLACLVGNDVAYGDYGLLDRTHIRFFGLKNIEELFAQAALKIVEARFVITEPEQTELAARWQQVPESVRAALRSSAYSTIYQVVVRAVALEQPGAAVSLLNQG